MIPIRFVVNDRLVRDHLGRIMTQLPQEMAQEGEQFTSDVAREIRSNVVRKKLVWKGNLLRSINSVKIAKDKFGVKMLGYGQALDSGQEHYHGIKRGRKIQQWATQKRNMKIKTNRSRVYRGPRGGVTGGVIYSTQTPFIKEPVQSMARSLRGRFSTALARGMK